MKALWKFVLVLCVGLATPLFITTPAAAEDDAVVDMARQRFREGVEFFDKKQYDKARAAFLQAYALKAHPAVLLNLAQSELRSEREAEAAAHFAQYLREHGDATEEQHEAAVEGLAAAKEKVAEVKLEVSEPGADINVEGEDVGKSPLLDPLYLKPGSYLVTATKGDQTARKTVEARAGASTSETLSFEPPKPVGPAKAPRGDKVSGAEEDQDEDDAEADEDADDSASGAGFVDWYANRPLAWVGTGLFAAGATVGVISAVTARNYYDSADDVSAQITDAAIKDNQSTTGICVTYPPVPADRQAEYQSACHKYDRNIEQGDKYERYAIVGFVVSGVALAGTIVYYVLDSGGSEGAATDSKTRRTATSSRDTFVVPYAGPGLAGLNVVGRF